MKKQPQRKSPRIKLSEQNQKKNSGNPHDQFFKVIYSSPENALDIFKIILPKSTYEQCNWNTLKPEKETFTEKEADLVFSVTLKTDPKSKIKIFILIEHKSYYSKDLFKQVLGYQNSIYQKDKSGDILLVLPVLVLSWRKALAVENIL